MPGMKAAVAAVAAGTGAGADAGTVGGLKYEQQRGPGMAEACG